MSNYIVFEPELQIIINDDIREYATELLNKTRSTGKHHPTYSLGEGGLVRHTKALVRMQLPEGYEANIVSRSSTFKLYGILQTNSYGVIDNTYCGDDDVWKFPAYATRDTVIHENDRICQFRINKIQLKFNFEEVESLGNKDRGSFVSTGIR